MNQALTGKTIVITGASNGIGRAAAKELASRGATLAIVGRNPARTAAAAAEVGGTAFLADFDRLDDVRALAEALLERYDGIDVLANNAGGLAQRREKTVDGFERTVQANYLAPVLLTSLLIARVRESGGRVISTASNSNTSGRVLLANLDRDGLPWLGGWPAYAATKLEMILFIRELARRYPGIEAYSFHPGYVASGFGDEVAIMRFAQWISAGHLGLSNEQGAEPLVMLAGSPSIGAPSGAYFSRNRPDGAENRRARDPELARQLWEKTTELLGIDWS